MHTVYRRLSDDEIMYRSTWFRYVGLGIVAFLMLLSVALLGLLIVYLGRDAAIGVLCFIVGGLCGIQIERGLR